MEFRPWWRVFVIAFYWTRIALCRQRAIRTNLVTICETRIIHLICHHWQLHMIQIVHTSVIWRMSVILMRIWGRLWVWHWITSSLHTAVWVHDVIYLWDSCRTPNRWSCVHTAIRDGTRNNWRFTIYWRGWWWWRRLGFLWCWRFWLSLLCFLLLTTFSPPVFKPDLKK